MIQDAHTFGALHLPKDAIVVVGAGAAGIPLAVKLADRGHQVILDESASLNQGLVDAQPFLGLATGRARVLGGTTPWWLGQCMRMFDIDLRPWLPGCRTAVGRSRSMNSRPHMPRRNAGSTSQVGATARTDGWIPEASPGRVEPRPQSSARESLASRRRGGGGREAT